METPPHMGAGIWFGKNICPFLLGIVKEVTAVDCDYNVNKARVQEEGEYVGLSLQQHLKCSKEKVPSRRPSPSRRQRHTLPNNYTLHMKRKKKILRANM